jgi:predicted HTH transcriptional regulator
MSFDITPFKRGIPIYPQPVALSCGRICRAHTNQERLDAIIKCAEVLTRYLAALAVSSFCAREKQETPPPEVLRTISGNLSFGHFLSAVQAIAQVDEEHPLKAFLDAGFKGKKGKPSVADAALSTLLTLRNDLGHDLMSLSNAKVAAVFVEHKPEEQLKIALQSLDRLLSHPLFLLEDQHYAKKTFTARRLVFMGDSDPIPDEIDLSQGLEEINVLYIGLKGGALCLHPFLIWDLAEKRFSFGIYIVHGIEADRIKFITVHDDKHERNSVLLSRLRGCLEGRCRTLEDVTLKNGKDMLQEWITEKKVREKAASETSGVIPWEDLDAATLSWYGWQLKVGGAEAIRSALQEHLLDGREIITPDEVRQVVLLFGKENAVKQILRRGLLDCRAKRDASSEQRWDERVESSQNVLECLRLAIEFFGRHVGVEGVTLDGLKATSGTADYIAMREGLVNLFIHQDYNDPRTVGQVEITEHRAVFYNAGKSLVSDESLVNGGKSQARNPLIGRALRMVGFAELAGSGLRELHSVWRQAKRRPPNTQSSSAANTFTLTLDWRLLPESYDEFWKTRLGVKISLEQASILSLLADPSGFSVEEIASARGLLVEDARTAVEFLATQGLILEKRGKYFIQDHLSELLKETKGA